MKITFGKRGSSLCGKYNNSTKKKKKKRGKLTYPPLKETIPPNKTLSTYRLVRSRKQKNP
jgi:hypothetical protein